MLTIKKLSLVGALVAAMTLSAHALSITPATLPQWIGNDNSNLSAAEIGAIVGVTPLTVVHTVNPGGQDPTGVTISGLNIVATSIFLYVKDGNHIPAFYIFDLVGAGWNGTDDLVLSGFWEGTGGSISHVTILTGEGTPSVPDAGGTLALLGLAIGSLGLARRKLSA